MAKFFRASLISNSFVFPEVTGDAAFGAAERLVRILAESTIPAKEGEISFTVSVGVSHLKADDESLEELIKRADRALYAAKEKGRNRAVNESDI